MPGGFWYVSQLMSLPEFLTHYYEFSKVPLRKLPLLLFELRERVLEELRAAGGSFASQRPAITWLSVEDWKRKSVVCSLQKGGAPGWHSRIYGLP